MAKDAFIVWFSVIWALHADMGFHLSGLAARLGNLAQNLAVLKQVLTDSLLYIIRKIFKVHQSVNMSSPSFIGSYKVLSIPIYMYAIYLVYFWTFISLTGVKKYFLCHLGPDWQTRNLKADEVYDFLFINKNLRNYKF